MSDGGPALDGCRKGTWKDATMVGTGRPGWQCVDVRLIFVKGDVRLGSSLAPTVNKLAEWKIIRELLGDCGRHVG